ncbi:MAG: hypothetical protein J6K45_00810 [Clostridia bacterium]|nr:hypothetical protein [Clostridia bacterium]
MRTFMENFGLYLKEFDEEVWKEKINFLMEMKESVDEGTKVQQQLFEQYQKDSVKLKDKFLEDFKKYVDTNDYVIKDNVSQKITEAVNKHQKIEQKILEESVKEYYDIIIDYMDDALYNELELKIL